LVFPLVVGALAEIEERTLTLETRAAQHRGPRTPLEPPHDGVADRLVRWGAVAAALAAVGWRVAA
jgi:energy-coupling factor transporter transmembrane protein EcfT